MPPSRQRGFVLAELAIGLMLALLAATWAGGRVMRTVLDAQAEATGAYLLAVKGAMDGVIAGNFHAYARGLPIANADGTPRFVDPWAPSLTELRSLGHLPAAFPAQTPAGQAVAIRVSRDASHCPGSGCRVEALVYTTTGFRAPVGTDPDYGAAAVAVQAMQGWGGAAWQREPGTLRGAAFAAANPVGPNAGGIVAATAMLDTSMWQQFVRVGDDRDPSLQGNLSMQGSASAQRVGLRETVVPNAPCVATDFANPSLPAGMAIDMDGNVDYAKTAAGGLAACLGGVWRAIATVASAGAACGDAAYPEGAVGNDVSGASLLCRDGRWSALSQWLSRYAVMSTQLAPASLTAAATVTSVAKPTCGSSGGVAGTPQVYVIPQSMQNRGSFALTGTRSGDNIVVSGTMTLDPLNFSAANASAAWNVSVPANSQAIVVAYCVYA